MHAVTGYAQPQWLVSIIYDWRVFCSFFFSLALTIALLILLHCACRNTNKVFSNRCYTRSLSPCRFYAIAVHDRTLLFINLFNYFFFKDVGSTVYLSRDVNGRCGHGDYHLVPAVASNPAATNIRAHTRQNKLRQTS